MPLSQGMRPGPASPQTPRADPRAVPQDMETDGSGAQRVSDQALLEAVQILTLEVRRLQLTLLRGFDLDPLGEDAEGEILSDILSDMP